MRQFSNNVGYASHLGLTVRYHLEEATHGKSSTIENSNFWNNEVGAYLPYAQNTTLRNLKVINGTTPQPYLGVKGNIATKNITYENLTVAGYFIGIEVARRGSTVIRGGTFNNVFDILVYTAALENRFVIITGVPAQTKVSTVLETKGFGYPISVFFVQDIVVLNFGPFIYQRLYNTLQQASAVPFPDPRPDLPTAYIGLTNQQLWDQFGVALGGAIAPPDAFTAPNIVGLIASWRNR